MDSEPRQIAFGAIQLEAESTDGELIPVSVLIDPASTATFFREGIVRSLKLHGHSQTLRVEGVAETSSTATSEYLTCRLDRLSEKKSRYKDPHFLPSPNQYRS